MLAMGQLLGEVIATMPMRWEASVEVCRTNGSLQPIGRLGPTHCT